MRRQFGTTIIALLTALCPALAQDAGNAFGGGGVTTKYADGVAFEVFGVPPKGFVMREWHADVSGGRYKQLRLPMQCVRQVSFTLRLDNSNLDPEGRYIPSIQMGLENDSNESAELVLIWSPKVPRPYFYFYKNVNGSKGTRVYLGEADFHEETTVSLSWNDKNEVTAKVGGAEPVTTKLDHAPASLVFFDSGVLATFFNVNAEFVTNRPSNMDCVTTHP